MRFTFALVLALLAAGCLEGGIPDTPPERAAPPPGSLEVTAQPARADLAANGTVAFNLTLRANEAVTLQHPTLGEGGWLRAWLKGPGGERVSLYPYGEGYPGSPDATERIRLEPGLVENHTVHWNGRMKAAEPQPHGGPQATPGNWTLIAVLRGVGEWGPIANVTVHPAYTFTLEPSEATLRVGDVQRFNLTLRVHEDTTLEHPSGGCGSWFQVRVVPGGEPESPISLYEYGEEVPVCPAVIEPITLEAGTVIREVVHWNGHETMAPPDPHEGPTLEPGAYRVEARLHGTQETRTATVQLAAG